MYDLIDGVVLHLTSKCNLKCNHCYVSAFSELEFSKNDLAKIIKLIKKINKPVDITGGEPLIHKDFTYFINNVIKNNITISSIFTNGTIVDKNFKVWDRIYKFNKDCRVYISLDGFQNSHNEFRNAKSFEKTLNNALMLKQIGFKVSINTILHKGISNKDINEMFHLIVNDKFDRWRVDTPFNAGNWINNKHLGLEIIDAFDIFSLILKLWLKNNKPFELELNHTLKYIDNSYIFLDNYSLEDSICPCKVLTIWPDGKISWCQDINDAEYIIGDITEDFDQVYEKYKTHKSISIKTMMNSPEYLKNNEECLDCDLIVNCGTGCRANSILSGNNFYGRDEEICSIYKNKYYKLISDTLIEFQA